MMEFGVKIGLIEFIKRKVFERNKNYKKIQSFYGMKISMKNQSITIKKYILL